MQHPLAVLKPEYTALLSQMKITRLAAIDETAERLLRYVDAGHYDAGCRTTGVPIIVAAASFEREASSNFTLNPAQGWPLTSRSRDVPYNGPFSDWTTAQIAAYQIDGLDKIGAPNWSWETGCYEEEAFNGWGYRAHGIPLPYLFGGTSIQKPGKYTSDGHYEVVMDTQLGVIPMMLRMVQIRPALALPFPFPSAVPEPSVPQPIIPPPEGIHSAATLQTLLNKLGASPPLVVDGNFGRVTKRAVAVFQAEYGGIAVDGLAGPETWAAIEKKLAG